MLARSTVTILFSIGETKSISTDSCSIEGNRFLSYATPISQRMFRHGRLIGYELNTHKYSVTTSNHQSSLRSAFATRNITVFEVNECDDRDFIGATEEFFNEERGQWILPRREYYDVEYNEENSYKSTNIHGFWVRCPATNTRATHCHRCSCYGGLLELKHELKAVICTYPHWKQNRTRMPLNDIPVCKYFDPNRLWTPRKLCSSPAHMACRVCKHRFSCLVNPKSNSEKIGDLTIFYWNKLLSIPIKQDSFFWHGWLKDTPPGGQMLLWKRSHKRRIT